jgi:hypothetical protein
MLHTAEVSRDNGYVREKLEKLEIPEVDECAYGCGWFKRWE